MTVVAVLILLITPVGALASPAAEGDVYVVQWGDTLTKIAIRMGVSASELAAVNNITDPNFVWVGQRLVIPGVNLPSLPEVPVVVSDIYVVQPGDSLAMIAQVYGVSQTALAQANGLRNLNFIWVGQELIIPGIAQPVPTIQPIPRPAPLPEPTPLPAPEPEPAPPPAPAPQPEVQPQPEPSASGGTYVVQRGDMLAGIASKFGTTVAALVSTNGLPNPDYIEVGQQLRVGTDNAPLPNPAPSPAPQPAPPPAAPAYGTAGRWIDVNLSQQRLTAYEGDAPVFSTLISGGLANTPTVLGTYSIQTKLTAQTMSGPGYWLPNVPYVMYFYGGYAIHGTYWHNNFGQPMSHGCVNMTTTDAAWLFGWASIGTPVVTHW